MSSANVNIAAFQTSLNSLYTWFPTLLYGFIGVLPMYIMTWYNLDLISDRFQATYHDRADVFDFVIVGGGSSGLVVANRLSQNYSVLLLEAGGLPNPGQSIPGMAFLMLNYPQLDYMHLTVPQKHCCGALPGRKAGWSAGKALGGTSNLNFLIYLRGHQKDYDLWSNLTGDPSWSYNELLTHFKRIENYQGEFDNDEMHGHSGDMNLGLPDYLGMGEQFIQAANEIGYPRVDLNGKFSEGFSLINYPLKDGRRQGAFHAFLVPIKDRPNLTVYKFSQVNKILMRGPENEVYGVEYERHGVKKAAYAKKEVIISAGAIHSPKILMLSGIGPKKDLEQNGIEAKVDLPVGLNLQDHISVYLGPFFVDKPMSMLLDRDLNAKAFVDFTRKGRGILTSTGVQATGFISTDYAKKSGEADWPDIQYILLGTGVYEKMDKDFAHAFHVKESVLTKYFKHAKGKDSFQIIVSLARPLSRGTIKLGDSNPNTNVVIDPNYLSVKSDVDVLVEGIKRAVELAENTTLNARFTEERFPGCEDVEFRTDEYWRCLISQYTITLHHIVGSCTMGNKNSPEAVVNSELKVLGTKRLRVIDSSIAPRVIISNTNAMATMIGEKGAHLVLESWRDSYQDENNEIIR